MYGMQQLCALMLPSTMHNEASGQITYTPCKMLPLQNNVPASVPAAASTTVRAGDTLVCEMQPRCSVAAVRHRLGVPRAYVWHWGIQPLQIAGLLRC
jgi:hypothetical protein